MSDFMIVCGGTGGHLTPGIAIAEALTAKGHRCHLMVSKKKVDARLIRKYKHLQFIEVPGIAFSLSPLKLVRCLWELLQGLKLHVGLLSKIRPHLIIGFGGFLSVSVIVAGCLLGIDYVLHESNRVAGKAIRLLSFFAVRIYLPEGVRLRSLPPKTVRHCGFPIRKEIRKLSLVDARRYLGLPAYGKVLLIMGGSQGARSLNRWAEAHFLALAKECVHMVCITGLGHEPQTLVHRHADGRLYKGYFKPFVDNIHYYLSACDLVVARAGAGSIAECVRCLTPMILVPYPHSADDHQQANAFFIEQQGCGIVIDDNRVADQLLMEVRRLINNTLLLFHFGKNLKRLDHVDSLSMMVQDIELLVKEQHE